MKAVKIIKHIVIIAVAVFLILGVPFLRTDYFAALKNGSGQDATSSASLILDQPSGTYVVLINREEHTNEENLAIWTDFFEGREISYIFEDIRCAVAQGDAGGLEMAQSYQSRLPENQMMIRQEDGTLMLSKAEHGKFDIIVLSQEMADAFDVSALEQDPDILMIHVEESEE